MLTVVPGTTVGDLVAELDRRYGPAFAAVRATARIWVDGDEPPAGPATPLGPDVEVAVLPPVSGGTGGRGRSGGGGSGPPGSRRPDVPD